MKDELGHKIIITYFYEQDRSLIQQISLDANNYKFNIFDMIFQIATASEYQYYKIEGNITSENIINSFRLLQQNKLPKVAKSELSPTRNDKPVKIAVYNNFHEMVVLNKVEFLVLFYRDTCPHCRKIKPIFE